ncbi:MAG TPA: ABC transporter substrate-binding protein [Planctomycetota bacterium]|nr:ABC transporter substrate-binding protein [Planctomycetota bacterium]
MRTVWIILFCLFVGALALGPSLLSDKPAADEKIVIISPHWDGIKHEFGRAFEEYYFRAKQKRIAVEWLDIGGTGEIRKFINQRFAQTGASGGIGVDILFGGGMDMLPRFADANFFEPYPLPPDLESAIPAAVHGQPLRDKQNRFHAACLSGFGFVYNSEVLESARLPAPKAWGDLGRPEFRGWVTCGDPGQSGSLHQAFELVLQAEGWDKGYRTLGRMLSNVRACNEGGTSIPRDVSLGQAAVGPCIDFYASAPARRQGATHLQLVIPEGVSLATPDCIAMFRSPQNPAAAQEFIRFVMSETMPNGDPGGQRLWYQVRGSEGGPKEYDCERLPVMPSVYEKNYPTFTVINPFKDAPSFKYDGRKTGDRWDLMNLIWRAMFIDVQDHLWDARKAIIDAKRDADLGFEVVKPPFTEEQLMSMTKVFFTPDQRNSLRNKWSAWARKRYQGIAKAAQHGSAYDDSPAPLPDGVK